MQLLFGVALAAGQRAEDVLPNAALGPARYIMTLRLNYIRPEILSGKNPGRPMPILPPVGGFGTRATSPKALRRCSDNRRQGHGSNILRTSCAKAESV